MGSQDNAKRGGKRPRRDLQRTVERPVDADEGADPGSDADGAAPEGTEPDTQNPFDGPPEASPFEETLSHGGPEEAPDPLPPKPAALRPSPPARAGDSAWDNFDEGADRWLEMSQTGAFVVDTAGRGDLTQGRVERLIPSPAAAPPPEDPIALPPPSPPAPAPAAFSSPAPSSAPVAAAVPQPSAPAPFGAPPLAQLVVTDGGLVGQVFALSGSEVRIGRAARNDVVLADPSLSREHARLSFIDGAYHLSDLQSGNGTFVAGRRIEQAVLQFGQQLTFGSVSCRFENASRTPPSVIAAAPASRALMQGLRSLWRRPPTPPPLEVSTLMPLGRLSPPLSPQIFARVAAAAVALGLFVGACGFFAYRLQRLRAQSQLHVALGLGITAFAAHDFDAAAGHFAEGAIVAPRNARLQHYLQALPRERLAQTQLSQAQQAVQGSDWPRAHALAQGILDSTFRADAQKVLQDIDGELEVQVARAQAAVDGGQFDEATRLLAPVQGIYPDRPDVNAVMVKVRLQSRGGSRIALPRTPAAPTAASKPQFVELSGRLGAAQRAFTAGNIDDALHILDAVNSEAGAALRLRIENFASAYETGVAAHLVKRAGASIVALQQAKSLASAISGGNSHLLSGINHRLADMYYVQGTEQLAQGALPEAYASFRSGIEAEPDHAYNRRQLSDLLGRAKQIYDGLGTSTPTDGLKAGLLMVLRITPAEAELHRQARSRLNRL